MSDADLREAGVEEGVFPDNPRRCPTEHLTPGTPRTKKMAIASEPDTGVNAMLTDAKARAAKTRDKPDNLYDERGLHLYVSKTGTKS
jgi:hypothetical protein